VKIEFENVYRAWGDALECLFIFLFLKKIKGGEKKR